MFKKGLLLALALVVSAAAMAQQPRVAVTRRPIGIMQDVNGPVDTDSFVVANAGSEMVSISLSRSATFFTTSPSSFVLQPGATQTVTIRPAFSSGYEEGHVNINVGGFPHPITVPVRIFIASRPQGSTTPILATGLIVTSGRAGQSHSGSFNMSNNGSVTMQGTLISDAPWIVPPLTSIYIALVKNNAAVAARIAVALARLRREG